MPNMFIKCGCGNGTICMYCMRIIMDSISIITGALIAWKARKAIDIQIAFYRLINWKIEPISMDKEIRNTRIMGAILLVIGIAAFISIYFF